MEVKKWVLFFKIHKYKLPMNDLFIGSFLLTKEIIQYQD